MIPLCLIPDEDETIQLEEVIQDDGEMDLDTKDTDYRASVDDKMELEEDDEMGSGAEADDHDDDLGIKIGEVDSQGGDGGSVEEKFITAGTTGAIDKEILDTVVKEAKQLEENIGKTGDIGPVEVGLNIFKVAITVFLWL